MRVFVLAPFGILLFRKFAVAASTIAGNEAGAQDAAFAHCRENRHSGTKVAEGWGVAFPCRSQMGTFFSVEGREFP